MSLKEKKYREDTEIASVTTLIYNRQSCMLGCTAWQSGVSFSSQGPAILSFLAY
jgi:hypothetical protein